jgi:4-alpha-glucanotransferase
MRRHLGELPIIAEDLGDLSPAVPALLEKTGYPGMRVLQFAFSTDRDDPFLTHNYPTNTVAYTGTHDNDTTLGWWQSAPPEERDFAAEYLDIDDADPVGRFLEVLWASPAMFAVTTLQDLLRGGPGDRMNTPGTTSGNWQWRARRDDIGPALVEQLRSLNQRHGRISPDPALRDASSGHMSDI